MKQAIAARADLGMGAGKLAAQVAHASLKAYERASPEMQREWKSTGQKKVVLRVDDKAGLVALADQAERGGVPYAMIRDAGRTELAPGTMTALAVGPGTDEEIDRITGDLSLY